jgi:hypothetical protein
MPADERIIKALIRFGLDKDSIAQVRGGSKSVEDALKQIDTQAEKTRERVSKMKTLFDGLDSSGRSLSRIGMGLRDIGDFLGSKELQQAGSLVSGVGQLTGSLSDLYEAANKLKGLGGGIGGAVMGGVAAIGGGLAAGGAFYDRIIKTPDRADAGTISKQFLSGAGATLSGLFTQIRDGQGYAEAYRKTLDDTSKMYGLIENDADHYNRQLKESLDLYGSSTLMLVDMEHRLKQMAAGAGGGLLGTISGSIGGAMSGVFGAAATVSAQNDPAVKAYAQYREQSKQAEADYQKQRFALVAAGFRDQLSSIKEFTQNEAQVKRTLAQQSLAAQIEFGRQEVAARVEFTRTEAGIVEDEQRRRISALDDFARSEARTEEQYRRQREQALLTFERGEARTEAEQKRARSRDLADFLRADLQTESDYYANRAKQAERYGVDISRAEEDHRLQMLRMAEDENAKLSDLQDARDAFGIIRARREQEVERQRVEQDYQIRVARGNQDYARDLSEQEAAFAEQRASRLSEFERRAQDQDQENDRQRIERKADFDLQLAEQQQDYARAKAERQADSNRQAEERQADFERQATDRLANFNQQAEERKTEFSLQTQDRKQQAEQQASERLAAFVSEMNQRKQDASERLAVLSQQFTDEKSKREDDFKARLEELGIYLPGEKEKRLAYYKLMADDLDSWLGGMRANTAALQIEQEKAVEAARQLINSTAGNILNTVSGGIGSFFGNNVMNNPPSGIFLPPVFKASGGYASGPVMAGERGYEFMLNHETTRAAESAAGGALSQDALLGMIAGARGGQ